MLREAAGYIDVIVTGGEVALPLVGIGRHPRPAALAGDHRGGASQRLPEDAPERVALTQVARFARLAADNLDVSKPILATIGSPVDVKQTNVSGATTSLSSFFVAVAVTVSLMFVALLLAAGLLALEREQHAFGRLVRGLVSRTALLSEKVLLAALCSLAVCLLMLCGLAALTGLDWARAPAWLARAGRAAALGFAAMGTAIGALAREVQAASLLAFAAVAAGRLPRARAVRRRRRDGCSRVIDARLVGCSRSSPRWRRSTRRSRAAGSRAAAAPARAHARLLGARAPVSAPLRVTAPRLGAMAFPATRMRRMRATAPLRGLARETELSASHLVYPMFVVAGGEKRTPIAVAAGDRPPEHRRRRRGGRDRRTRSASRPCCCSASRPPRTSSAPAPTTTRA